MVGAWMEWAANGNGNGPLWLWIVAVATPILAFVGAFVGHVISRSASKELDHWRRREETMRLLRWPQSSPRTSGLSHPGSWGSRCSGSS
jgi:hypothetical protein